MTWCRRCQCGCGGHRCHLYATIRPHVLAPRPGYLRSCNDALHAWVLLDTRVQSGRCISAQGNVEGVKLSQCDFVAVTYGVYAEHCLQARPPAPSSPLPPVRPGEMLRPPAMLPGSQSY